MKVKSESEVAQSCPAQLLSVQFSRSVVSDSLRPHESQHARPPCRSVVSGSVALLKEDFPGGSDGKATAYNAGDLGSIPGLGRPPEEGNGYPLQYSGLEHSMTV